MYFVLSKKTLLLLISFLFHLLKQVEMETIGDMIWINMNIQIIFLGVSLSLSLSAWHAVWHAAHWNGITWPYKIITYNLLGLIYIRNRNEQGNALERLLFLLISSIIKESEWNHTGETIIISLPPTVFSSSFPCYCSQLCWDCDRFNCQQTVGNADARSHFKTP